MCSSFLDDQELVQFVTNGDKNISPVASTLFDGNESHDELKPSAKSQNLRRYCQAQPKP